MSACARILRPVVRLAIAKGLKYQHLESLLRDLFLEEARRLWRSKGVEPNLSQVSVTTGLNRKIVTARSREPGDTLPHTEMSAAAKTLTLWLQMVGENGALRSLPIADGGGPSFESVARQASRGNVHHRTILDELVRLDMVLEQAGQVELKASGFVPVEDLQAMLAFLGDNARDHIFAGVANIMGGGPRMLERAVYASGLALHDCERIHELVRERWGSLHGELAREMRQALDSAPEPSSGRIRVGVYTYYEDAAAEAQLSVIGPARPPVEESGK
ncbi:conserved hypothetical protein [Burkholderiales bacterium 8X]|nr:conserved hypothetical protein [Burkholderiales bacterium 8X]